MTDQVRRMTDQVRRHVYAQEMPSEPADNESPDVEPPYLGVWCPTCWLDTIPSRAGYCLWCETKIAEPE